jgi:hypothetical protein
MPIPPSPGYLRFVPPAPRVHVDPHDVSRNTEIGLSPTHLMSALQRTLPGGDMSTNTYSGTTTWTHGGKEFAVDAEYRVGTGDAATGTTKLSLTLIIDLHDCLELEGYHARAPGEVITALERHAGEQLAALQQRLVGHGAPQFSGHGE